MPTSFFFTDGQITPGFGTPYYKAYNFTPQP